MNRYDPNRKPDAESWLNIPEERRVRLALEYHRRVRTRVANLNVHAVIHVAVENQIALGDDYAVDRTVRRLMAEGLDRHEAIHAVGAVLIGHLAQLAEATPDDDPNAVDDPNAAYIAALGELTAENYRRGE
jgi:hypothetical protein